MRTALGLLELKQVGRGVAALDALGKAADVRIISAGPVCPGKYLLMVAGDVSSVTAAMEAVLRGVGSLMFDYLTLADIAPEALAALQGLGPRPRLGEALGLIETISAAAAVRAADGAVKTADVRLVDVRASRGMGGRALVVFAGSVGACEAARGAGAQLAAAEGMLLDSAVIASPHPDLLPWI